MILEWIWISPFLVAAVAAAAGADAVAALVTAVLATASVDRPAVFAAGDFLVTASAARVWDYQHRPARGLLGDPSVRLYDPWSA